MCMASAARRLAACLTFTVVASELCLDDGIPEESRAFIRTNLGESIPIGFLACSWPSSYLLNEMAAMIVQEGLGYHARVDPRVGASGASPIYALGGCANFDSPTDKRCGENETEFHVAVDAWIGSYAGLYTEFQKDYPSIAPIDLGTMGYAGEESMFFARPVLHAAYEDSGLGLDFFKSYNTTHHNAKKYFDSVADVNVAELSPCNATDFINPLRMGNYAKYSGDTAGVQELPDNTTIAICPDGYWWLAPACRHNISECIPVFTAGNGWKLQAMMQWTTAYGIPAAIAISGNWSNFVNHVRSVRSLFYWWVPDSTFIEMQPSEIVFPRHSANAWARGDKTTGAAGVYVSKMASTNLKSKAGRVQEFVAKMQFELPEVQDMLLEYQRLGADEVRSVACNWMKKNQERWRSWMPIDTACFAGFGLVDAQGAFVDNRTSASRCGLCAAGRASEEVQDSKGKTYRCTQCPPGYFQSQTYSTHCEPCPKGTVTNSYGSVECQHCEQGFYQEDVAKTNCTLCPSSTSTKLLGASGLGDCVCVAGLIDVRGVCASCPEGLWCPLGSTIPLLQSVQGTNKELPHVLRGFHSDPILPLAIFKCQDDTCPGGSPGTCFGGRQGITCGHCPVGQYWLDRDCADCGAAMYAWIFAVIAFCAGIFSSYYLLTSSYTAKASTMACTTASLGMMLSTFQNLGVLSLVNVDWPEGLRELLEFCAIFTMSLDNLGFRCLVDGDVYGYVSFALFFVLVNAAVPMVGALSRCMTCLRRRGLAWDSYKSLSTTGQFLQVSFTTLANVGLIPFMCYSHPSGQESVLKYTEVICGGNNHTIMVVFGSLVVTQATIFFSLCCYLANVAPSLSAKPKLAVARFLIFRFRADVWWFGLVLLARGPLLSLPAVVATNMPALNLTLMLAILLTSLGVQMWFLPWKSPILNLIDAVTIGLMVLLLAISLGMANTTADLDILQICATVVSFCIVAVLVFMVLLSLSAICHRHALGGQQEFWPLNLGRRPDSNEIFKHLMDVADNVMSLSPERRKDLLDNIHKLSVYDLDTVMRSIDILADDLAMEMSQKRSFASRISAQQRSIRSENFSLRFETPEKRPRSRRSATDETEDTDGIADNLPEALCLPTEPTQSAAL
ncbi:unnamed protein product [Effrenium voratum]|uniref:Tyrosine-protein kinase ephrin type A/B receptor-like domain-containing protein n=1 Tax=Effrenium voratum TaxID=2562239 RepID=A0AA36HLX9_9DINO|nr:unnamed protein product [Effrenium voratum]